MADFITEKLESCSTFRVDVYCSGYPDVLFEIILDAVPAQTQKDAAVQALEKFVSRYNALHFLRPIHYISGIDDPEECEHPRGIYIHIDFGNASPLALVRAVTALEKTDLPIFRVALL